VRDGLVGVLVGELEHADRRQQERAGEPAAEQLDAGVALGDVAQHPRDDPPLVERGAVGVHRPLVAGAGADVGECVASERSAASSRLESSGTRGRRPLTPPR
jgi:hypothetical protein